MTQVATETYEISDSSRITKVVFTVNAGRRDLRITFKGDKVYDYTSISEYDFREFKRCITEGESVGKAFEKYIRNKYAGQKQPEKK